MRKVFFDRFVVYAACHRQTHARCQTKFYGELSNQVQTFEKENKIQDPDDDGSVTIAVSYDENGKPDDYEKFSLIVCSRSTGEYSNLFYKFRIVDHVSAI